MRCLFLVSLLTAVSLGPAQAQNLTPTGARLTPFAAKGSQPVEISVKLPDGRLLRPDHLASLALDPSETRLAALTSGFNRIYGPDGKIDPAASTEWVFIFDLKNGVPVRNSTLPIPNAFGGLAWSADGKSLYVSGGVDDDLHIFTQSAGGRFGSDGTPIKLGHAKGLGLQMKPEAGAIAASPDGRRVVVANYFNDSISMIDLKGRAVETELNLRPGKGLAGGEYPIDVQFISDNEVWVLSQRDRQVVVVAITGGTLTATQRIALPGQPSKMVFDRRRNVVHVAIESSDQIVQIDLKTHALISTVPIWPVMDGSKPAGYGTGLNGLALSPDGNSLWATLGHLNAVGRIALDHAQAEFSGMIPTAWYPTALAVSPAGSLIIVNGKTPPGPNPGGCRSELGAVPEGNHACRAHNEYVLQLEHAGMVAMPVPDEDALGKLTAAVAQNDHFQTPKVHGAHAQLMEALRARIRHVFFVVKENRTFDQVLGDLPKAKGNPKLALLAPFAPNHHTIASGFVTLDAFYAAGEVSNTGWSWTTSGRTTDALERISPVNYAARGLDYSAEGSNRNLNTGLDSEAARRDVSADMPDDPDLLPGTSDIAAPDPVSGEAGADFLWDQALRQNVSLRNYGFMADLSLYQKTIKGYLPPSHSPFAENKVQTIVTKAALKDVTDPFFRSFDQTVPDYWRFQEWAREFDGFERDGNLPSLNFVRFAHDHFGDFKEAEDGVNSVETEMADNDYALGLFLERIAHSRYAADSLVFVIEDDAQNGADHIDAHRTVALVAGPFVKQHQTISARYSTLDMIRTISDILGLKPLGLETALSEPMAEIFDLSIANWEYRSVVPDVLRKSELPLPEEHQGLNQTIPCHIHDAAYWTQAMAKQDFSAPDHLDAKLFNAALMRGLKTSFCGKLKRS